jgi:PadR family transcriptional regulator, regulatory protein AphA
MARQGATTTTFAILGLLAAGPGSPYELNQRLQLSCGYFWPRARSQVFTEVKRLASLEWATGAVLLNGRRARTEYTITDLGMRALQRWLHTTPAIFDLEFEHLVRVYLAGFASPADLLGVFDDAEQRAAAMLALADQVIDGYEHGQIDGPHDEPHLRVLLVDYLANLAQLTVDWAQRSRADVRSWDPDLSVRRDHALARLSHLPRKPSGEPIEQ